MHDRRIDRFVAEAHTTESGSLVVVRGEVDIATADSFAASMAIALERGGRIEVDLRETTFMDSSGLAVLIRAHRDLRPEAAHRIVLLDPHPAVRRLLDIAKLDVLFDVRDAPGAARQGDPAEDPSASELTSQG